MPKPGQVWKLALACVLGALQAAVLAVGLFAPRVSPGYRAYFIDHSIPRSMDWLPGPDLVPETRATPFRDGAQR